MSKITLVAETGRAAGTRPTRRLRGEGKIPAIVYGHGMTPLSVSVDWRELRHALSGPAGLNAIVHLTVDGREQPTIVKELQRHPVRRTVSHVDFQVVSMTEEIRVDIPLHIEGEASALEAAGGILENVHTTLPVITTPRDLPPTIIIDVSNLAPGDVVRVGDLDLPAGVTAALDDDEVLVVATLPQAGGEEVEAVEEAGAEAAGEAESAAPSASEGD